MVIFVKIVHLRDVTSHLDTCGRCVHLPENPLILDTGTGTGTHKGGYPGTAGVEDSFLANNP
jgi:hypothetical protein